MRLKITSKAGLTSVVNVETGESLPVTALRFEQVSYDELPRLTLTLLVDGEKMQVEAELHDVQLKPADDETWRDREPLL
jgi:ribosomal protein L3